MTKHLMAAVLTWLLACGTALAQSTQASSTDPASVKLIGVWMELPAGAPWLTLRFGEWCMSSPKTTTWSAGREKEEISSYFSPFKTELERAGYKVVTPGESNLFDPGADSADYEAAAVITDAHFQGCVSRGGFVTNRGDVRGEGSLKIDWQIYSRVKKQVVARISTNGTTKLDKSVPGGGTRLVVEAFASNVRELAIKTEFRAAMTAPKAFTQGFVVPGRQEKIALLGSLKAPARRIEDAVGSVVTIMSGLGNGSGILVSSDGYVLTNAHVVGDDKTVRLRWSDRIETLGEVVRVSKDRDVALVKTNPRERTPLAIKRGALSPGQRVYAIGTPLDKAFQSSVSSGVVSGNRIIDGLRFIQSDTSVAPGSSGGALLDETGSVIGITVAGIEKDGSRGINLFIPIGDAMDFLSLEPR
ncbi:MAG TPA: trypsin-like peptidase domain-containing protein [Rhizomicrobium sp.]|nr:trypsin-like peptidase domain-containing protein [Rhizomicrobium sp.]